MQLPNAVQSVLQAEHRLDLNDCEIDFKARIVNIFLILPYLHSASATKAVLPEQFPLPYGNTVIIDVVHW